MIPSVIWKEYREQRGLWLGLAVLALGLSFGLAIALPPQGFAGLAQDHMTRTSIMVLLISFSIGYPLVCGAMLLAGEREGGTWDFLNYTAGRQGPVWNSKAWAGLVLTLTMTLLLAALAVFLDLPPNPAWRWRIPVIFPLLGVDAFVWGLLASAWCRTVLKAVGLAIVLWTASWLLSVIPFWLVGSHLGFFAESAVCKTPLAVLALTLSYRRYCRAEFEQRASVAGRGLETSALTALCWLMMRQGKIELITIGLLSLAGSALAFQPLIGWPVSSLTVGLICGFAVFGHEQARGEERFLGSLRLPPWRFWFLKVGFWVLVAMAALTLAYGVGYLTLQWRTPVDTFGNPDLFHRAVSNTLLASGFDKPLHLNLWPVHGFCFGLFFSLLFRRTVLAVLLGTTSCLIVLALWLPTLVCGGFAVWVLFAIPGFLLIVTRWAVWTWMSGRLLSGRCMAGLVLAGALAILFLIGSLWQRAVEIPDLGEPFDVATYRAELDAAGRNPAGAQLRQVALDFKAWRQKVDEEIGPAKQALVWDAKDDNPIIAPRQDVPHWFFVYDVIEQGWPREEGQFGRWLEQMLQGPWAKTLQETVNLAPGLFEDPRVASHHELDPPDRPSWLLSDAGRVFTVRAVQRVHQQKAKEALDDLGTVLSLARHVWAHAPREVAADGERVQATAFPFFQRWLQQAAPQRDLLRRALDVLRAQEQAQPETGELRKAAYVGLRGVPSIVYHHYHREIDGTLFTVALRAPWEKERARRLSNLVAATAEGEFFKADSSRRQGVLRRWIEYDLITYDTGRMFALIQLRGLQLQLALMLYQLDHGKDATSLQDLAPHYLPALPVNPFDGSSFGYRITQGEEFKDRVPGAKGLVAGRGVVSATAGNNSPYYFVVPVPKKK